MRPPDLHWNARLPADCAGCRHGQTLRGLRFLRSRRAQRRPRRRASMGVLPDFATLGGPRRGGHRCAGGRQTCGWMRRPAWSAASTRAAAHCAGLGTRFHPTDHPLRAALGTRVGPPNVWSILSGDEQRGLIFVPTGNASPDAYGGARDGLDYYSSSTVALRAETGEVAWHFQTVHHDVWDYDVASQPTLFQIDGVGGGHPHSPRPPRWATSSCCTARRASRFTRWKSDPCPRAAWQGETPIADSTFPHPSPSPAP